MLKDWQDCKAWPVCSQNSWEVRGGRCIAEVAGLGRVGCPVSLGFILGVLGAFKQNDDIIYVLERSLCHSAIVIFVILYLMRFVLSPQCSLSWRVSVPSVFEKNVPSFVGEPNVP